MSIYVGPPFFISAGPLSAYRTALTNTAFLLPTPESINIPAITHHLRRHYGDGGNAPTFLKFIILPTVIADDRKHQHSRHHSLPH